MPNPIFKALRLSGLALALTGTPAMAQEAQPELHLYARASGTSWLGAEVPGKLGTHAAPLRVKAGSRVELSARPDDPAVNFGVKLVYRWRQVSGPSVILLSTTDSGPTNASYMNLLLHTTSPGQLRFECVLQWVDAAGSPIGQEVRREIELDVI